MENVSILMERASHQWTGGILGIPETEACFKGRNQTGELVIVFGEYVWRCNHRKDIAKDKDETNS
jgi:hypothetical protein